MVDVRIKPLEWEELHSQRSDEDPNTEVVGFEAETPFDAWYSIDVRAADYVLSSVDAERTSSIHETENEAKAAAQADYERRILSTLSDAVAECEAEPVAWEWAAFEDGVQQGNWKPCGYGDEAGWAAIAKRNPDKYQVRKRAIYTSPPTSELEALRKRVTELEKALEPFADIADLIEAETEGMSETDELELHFHDYLMASWPVAMFRTARRVREGGKVDG